MMAETFPVPQKGIGLPDYSAPQPTGQVPQGPLYTSTDIAELAARLGSIVTFDRRGNVLWMDDFEDNINKWLGAGFSGVGGSVSLSTVRARNGASSARLITGNLIGDTAQLQKVLPYPYLSRIGFEISFTANLHLSEHFLRYLIWHGTHYYMATVRIIPPLGSATLQAEAVNRLQIVDNTLGWVDIDNVPMGAPEFNTVKLVSNPTVPRRYERLILNSREYDLRAYSLEQAVASEAYEMWFISRITTGVNANETAYADDAIITQNEPPNTG